MRCAVFTRVLVGAAAFGLLSFGAWAQDESAPQTGEEAAAGQQTEQVDPAQQVLSRIHRVNTMTIQAGELAQKNAASEDVKKLGKDVSEAQKKWDKKVTELAKEQNIELVEPTPLSEDDRAFMSEQNAVMLDLKNAKGKDFDRLYLTSLIERRDNVIGVLETVQPDIVDQQVKAVVSKTITALKDQRDRARKIYQTEFPSGGA